MKHDTSIVSDLKVIVNRRKGLRSHLAETDCRPIRDMLESHVARFQSDDKARSYAGRL